MQTITRDTRLRASVLGIAAALVVLGTAELGALLVAPESSPLFAVGSLAIDLAPFWLKELMIGLFGTSDKIALFVLLGIVLLALAVLAGLAELWRRWCGLLLLGIVAAVALLAILTRPEATPLWALPTLLGAVAGAGVLGRGRRLLLAWSESRTELSELAELAEIDGLDNAESGDHARTADSASMPHPAHPVVPDLPTEPGVKPRSAEMADSGVVSPGAGGGGALSVRAAEAVRSEAIARRGFLRLVGITSLAAVAVGLGARVMNGSAAAVSAIRSAVKLPRPAVAAPPIPAGAELDVPGISPLITANDDFYRIDIALQVPKIDPATWELRITGLVDTPITVTYEELLALPLEEHITTIACVSNTVGGDLIGTATWLGVPIRDLLARAGVDPSADMVLSSGPDGFTAGTPLEILTDPGRAALLAVGMNGEPLPTEHGFPARMIVPGLFGYVSATKWITSMEVTRFADAEGYWTPRGWSALGPVKTQSRIDTPRRGATVDAAAGTVPIAGVAWAPHTGITGVEVQIDEGPWRAATLATAISDDTWVQWSLLWDAEPGTHTARVRATDASGETQTSDVAPPAPSGATGWDAVTFTV
ncbi:molybdopterin-dependent oxidoreductase [Leucobacter rhizosphaerae]|uniref:Molybdopterin-dependent oxidoreductase n=1 Tax=Leucobacter rhizosphaerae TaxID=2932245 RepID=A0ABY4FUB7_9MICO|nr:molybdopterin-dependent oxidoreductase [Leucobacter rhizosphaerae]UOQ59891.1 molybdopterin-dependent oxidoreductase [Leucobacter rhizosphaerae]